VSQLKEDLAFPEVWFHLTCDRWKWFQTQLDSLGQWYAFPECLAVYWRFDSQNKLTGILTDESSLDSRCQRSSRM
jgi:hypothetical protein